MHLPYGGDILDECIRSNIFILNESIRTTSIQRFDFVLLSTLRIEIINHQMNVQESVFAWQCLIKPSVILEFKIKTFTLIILKYSETHLSYFQFHLTFKSPCRQAQMFFHTNKMKLI